MGSNRAAFAAIALACIAAAGVGGYFALRQNTATETSPVTATAPVTTTAAAPANEPAVATGKSVQETEDVVAPSESVAAKAPKKVEAKPEKAPQRTASAPAPKPVAAAPAPLPPPAPDPVASPRTETVERVAQDAPLPALPTPPQHTFDELVVSTDSVIGLQSDTTVTSERARVEDRVEARVTRDVKVGDRVAIPAGSRAIGYVSQVERGGKFKEQAKLAIKFQTIVLADGTRLPISTPPIEREGDSKTNSSAAKMGGGAIAGTILGAILGGGKGAAIGAAAGAGGGAAAVEASDRSVATLRAGESITIRLLSPVTVTSESK
jgi:type IV secretory pathway VirB10-like protein